MPVAFRESGATEREVRPQEVSAKAFQELPDDLGERTYRAELPDDSGEFPCQTENIDDAADLVYPSSYKERIAQTPKDDGERGNWQGERGESAFVPEDDDIDAILEKYDMDGVEYKDGIPDFSPCSESTVEISNMTNNRNGPPAEGSNFQQCDQKCAEQWNNQYRDGTCDWTARDVADWRRENGYSWHERNDMKTCDLIPTKVNAYFGHLGGVGEYIRLSGNQSAEGVFDE